MDKKAIAMAFQAGFVKWLESIETVDPGELARAFAIVVSAYLKSLPVEIRAEVAEDYFEEWRDNYLEKTDERIH